MTVVLLGLPAEIAVDAKILIVDSEAAAKRAQQLLPSSLVLWPSEAGSLHELSMESWIPLQGCDVLLWPSNIPACRKSAVTAANALQSVTDRVRMLYVNGAEAPYFSAADMGADWDNARLVKWATERVRPYEKEKPKDPMADIEEAADVPRLYTGYPHSNDAQPDENVTRGKPRTKANGQPTKGRLIESGDFVSWESMELDKPKGGVPYPNLSNAQHILALHPKLTGCIWYDEFHDRVFSTLYSDDGSVHEWSDCYDTRLTSWIQTNCRIPKMGVQTVQRAIDDFARLVVKNEPKEWMLDLVWDKIERLNTLMADGWGTPQNEYTAAVGRCWLVSMAARILSPGCQADYMPVFEGPQGLKKSTAIAKLGGKWFAEVHEDVTKKDFFQCLQGKMLVEISEMHAFKQQEVERIKGVVSCRNDRYRESYGRRAEDHPRRCVFSGTTNRDDWVKDDTGARRFWPILCGDINIDYIVANREQIFAEAVARYSRGESWWDVDVDLATVEQDARRDDDVWTEPILTWVSGKPYVTVPQVLEFALGISKEKQGISEQMRVGRVLRLAKWKKKRTERNGFNTQYWFSPTYPQDIHRQVGMDGSQDMPF